MPLHQLVAHADRVYAIWRIAETELEMTGILSHPEQIPLAVTHPQKRLEFLASRLLTQKLVTDIGDKYQGLIKDSFGKPFLRDSTWHVSQSHSYPYVAVILDKEKSTGIDIEQRKENLLRVASRVFSEQERNNAGSDLTHLAVLWCAKEALIKVYGKKDLTLKEEIKIEPFVLEEEGVEKGSIIKNNT